MSNNENQNAIRERCIEKWDHAIFHIKDSEFKETVDDFVDIRVGHTCRLKVSLDNRDFFFHIDTMPMRKDDFLEEIPLLHHKPTVPGFYTWVVSSKGEEKEFTCCKAFSILELGTIHKAITYRMKAEKVHAAGEMFVDDDRKVYFNFQSGTYMKEIFIPKSGKRRRNTCGPEEFGEFLVEKMKDYLEKDATYVHESFIDKYAYKIPITKEEYDIYHKYGAKITLFDHVDDCRKYRNGPRGGSRKLAAKDKRKTRRRI
jgi:hypothetical protein